PSRTSRDERGGAIRALVDVGCTAIAVVRGERFARGEEDARAVSRDSREVVREVAVPSKWPGRDQSRGRATDALVDVRLVVGVLAHEPLSRHEEGALAVLRDSELEDERIRKERTVPAGG